MAVGDRVTVKGNIVSGSYLDLAPSDGSSYMLTTLRSKIVPCGYSGRVYLYPGTVENGSSTRFALENYPNRKISYNNLSLPLAYDMTISLSTNYTSNVNAYMMANEIPDNAWYKAETVGTSTTVTFQPSAGDEYRLMAIFVESPDLQVYTTDGTYTVKHRLIQSTASGEPGKLFTGLDIPITNTDYISVTNNDAATTYTYILFGIQTGWA